MKTTYIKRTLTLSLLILSMATFAQTKKPAVASKSKPKPAAASSAADIAAGKELVLKSDCLACHKLNEKLVGPAYSDVAKKYKPTAATIEYLSGKIISGGSGAWGEVPMSPHPALSKEDSRKIVKYILSVK